MSHQGGKMPTLKTDLERSDLYELLQKFSCGSTEGRAIGHLGEVDLSPSSAESRLESLRQSFGSTAGVAKSEYQASPAGTEVQSGGFHPQPGAGSGRLAQQSSEHPGTLHRPQERGIGHSEQADAEFDLYWEYPGAWGDAEEIA